MSFRRIAGYAVVTAILVGPSWAAPSVTVTETYDGLLGEASWRVADFDVIAPTGGSPGAYLNVAGLDTFGPRIFTVPGLDQKFVGDYRSLGVTSLGVDVQLFSIQFNIGARPISLYLTSNNDTPEDPFDDCEAVYVSPKNVPKIGTGWKSVDVRIPSQSTTLPNGWVIVGECGGVSPDEAWNAVITHVTGASFYFGEPDFFYIFQVWDVGFDNPRITSRPGATEPL
jgi:hypothetical protein